MRIALDVMGGDYAPQEIIAGAVDFVEREKLKLILVGREEVIKEELAKYNYKGDLLEIVNASEVIGMDESPVAALRKKKDASIVIATKLVREGKADAVVSCGSTGAQMAAAVFILGRMADIERPPIITPVPNQNDGYTFLIDVGANVDCRPRQLLQFALLGKVYASAVMNIDNPRIALLNNGEEETKGSHLYVEAYNLLKEAGEINFIGNIEGRYIFDGKADVIVCDGFTGNIVLKTIEGVSLFIARNVARELGKLPSFFSKMDYTKIGGAPLLGINGVSIVCHGSSKREAVYNGLCVARDCVEKDIVRKQAAMLAQMKEN
ncbi:phosphate:acyl-[acyl carrier protein] acyltransferase [Thermosyntropha lipolytica DSM 11003]|uniref:Phosphate acyltransferase n=1 Tax=Thermosyntropha lipolytica DSM 11003 TaxID=1123382 RepID=A0A1M5PIV4_9FIRM|nr:phosphate acyltransferase PlsX [Thermosyntropha lipolytica]SHH01736.1 phosphate:acyl-[acyl carrier protein] acyltransferase [Thermosyntropha lipolytica DSM 11003]